MGYVIFGQKITGIQDIKTLPNGASVQSASHTSRAQLNMAWVLLVFVHNHG